MKGLATLVRWIDRLTGAIGLAASWLILPVVLVAFSVVVLRYVFSVGFPWLQELYIWLHGAAFVLAMAWVLRDGGHVRVDLFYKKWSARARAWADLIGVFVFLAPMMGAIVYLSWPLVQRSWRIVEKSPTSDGLTFLFLLKTLVPVACVLVLLQGLAMALRAVFVIARRDDLLPGGGASGGHG
jgi:TRAP-type mannitol/chloroaromatic compound transport system permease small subunit